MYFKEKFKRITKLLSTATVTGMIFTALSSMNAGATDIWQSADEVGNYVKNAPYGTVIGSIPEGTKFTTISTVKAWDGTEWGLCTDGSYICLDYCTRIHENSSFSSVYKVQSAYGFMNDNQQYIYSHFIQRGFPAESAAAISANIYDESLCSPTANCIDTNGLVSYGICQWNGERNIRLVNWCSANGYDYTSLEGQLAYLDYELANDYSNVYSTLIAGGDAWTLGYVWASEFEVCADYYWNTRGDNALLFYNNVSGR